MLSDLFYCTFKFTNKCMDKEQVNCEKCPVKGCQSCENNWSSNTCSQCENNQ